MSSATLIPPETPVVKPKVFGGGPPRTSNVTSNNQQQPSRPQTTTTFSTSTSTAIAAAAPTRKKKQQCVVTPTTKTSLDHRMAVDKNIVDELLLVCGVIGTTTNEGNELVPVTDCLNWLQDLQRALRRDEDQYRPISLLLGKWNVVQQKLIPLVMTCRYDTPIVLTVVKILVILTKPLSDNTKRAGQIVIDTTSPKSDPNVVVQQIKIRENALQQAERLMEYKRFVTFHPSHHHTKKQNSNNNNKDRAGGTGLLSIFVSLLAEPLSKSGASRTDADHLTIELVLHLIRNLLSAEPVLNSKLLFNFKKNKGEGGKKVFYF
jgi:timeless